MVWFEWFDPPPKEQIHVAVLSLFFFWKNWKIAVAGPFSEENVFCIYLSVYVAFLLSVREKRKRAPSFNLLFYHFWRWKHGISVHSIFAPLNGPIVVEFTRKSGILVDMKACNFSPFDRARRVLSWSPFCANPDPRYPTLTTPVKYTLRDMKKCRWHRLSIIDFFHFIIKRR